MTQEERDLLIKDLSGRLPYGVKGKVLSRDCNNRECEFGAIIDGKLYNRFAVAQELWFDNVIIKPYLFPLSSMTEEQKEEHKDLLDNQYSFDANGSIFTLQDFYNKYHFDYRGLIPMGLANDATILNIY